MMSGRTFLEIRCRSIKRQSKKYIERSQLITKYLTGTYIANVNDAVAVGAFGTRFCKKLTKSEGERLGCASYFFSKTQPIHNPRTEKGAAFISVRV